MRGETMNLSENNARRVQLRRNAMNGTSLLPLKQHFAGIKCPLPEEKYDDIRHDGKRKGMQESPLRVAWKDPRKKWG